MSLSLSHIAIACPQIEAVARKLEALGLSIEDRHEVPTEQVRVAFVPVDVSPHLRIELVEPTSADSVVGKFLATQPKGGLHHLSFAVDDLDEWFDALKRAKIDVLPPGIRTAARGKALFIHPREMGGVLVELEEIN